MISFAIRFHRLQCKHSCKSVLYIVYIELTLNKKANSKVLLAFVF